MALVSFVSTYNALGHEAFAHSNICTLCKVIMYLYLLISPFGDLGVEPKNGLDWITKDKGLISLLYHFGLVMRSLVVIKVNIILVKLFFSHCLIESEGSYVASWFISFFFFKLNNMQ